MLRWNLDRDTAEWDGRSTLGHRYLVELEVAGEVAGAVT
jgi:hypothetical protein